MKKASLLLLAFAAAPLVSAGVIINDAPAPVAAGSSSPNGMCASTDDQAVCAALTDLYKDTVSKSITKPAPRPDRALPSQQNGPGWRKNTGWLNGDSYCSGWYGVKCSKTGKVTSM